MAGLLSNPTAFSKIDQKPVDQLRAGFQVISLESSLLLRKEVIQPHVPVRLPCYDLVPVTDPTFGSSLQKWLGH